MNLPERLAGPTNQKRQALVGLGRHLSYRELDQQAAAWAAAIAEMVPAGGAVALRVSDPLQFVAAIVGTWRAGCPAVPIDAARTAADALGAVEQSGAVLLVSDCCEPSLERDLLKLACRVLRRPGSGRVQTRLPEDSDPALLLYTSGTTGDPKCAVFSHAAMVQNVDALILAAGLCEEDRFFSPLPPGLTTVLASCVLPALALGAAAILPGKFLPMQTRKLLGDFEPTVFLGVPYVYHLLSETANPVRLPRLRLCITNSAPMPIAVAAAFEERFGVLPRSNYCSSEAGGITYNRATDRRLLLETAGTPMPGVGVTITDPTGRPVAPGEVGQVVVDSPMAASGYLNRADLTARVFRGQKVWTDDLGVVGPDGYLRITGRLSHLVNVAGHLVNPEEVESVLLRHPAVAEALVVGRDDPEATQTLVALVVPRGHVVASQLREFCFRHLTLHKVPRRVHLVASLPRTSLGKLDRRAPVLP